MPLAEIQGWEKCPSKFCGLETDFSDDVPSLLTSNINNGGFDFVLTPLINPSYRPNESSSQVPPFASPQKISQWRNHVVGKISSWIDLDSEDESLRKESETAFKQEMSWANHLTLRACLLPTPKGTSCENYARCVNQILKRNAKMELWLRIPLGKSQRDLWDLWNSFRLLCDHDSKLSVALDDKSMALAQISIERWFGEPVKAAIISIECFPTIPPPAFVRLLIGYEEQMIRLFRHSVQVIISGRPLRSLQNDSVNIADGMQTNPYKPYLDCVSKVFRRMKPLSEKERIEFSIRDCLPLQPLKDNLDADSYESFETDYVKYQQYQTAIAKALMDRVPNEKKSELTTVLFVVGAGRGSLVMSSVLAADDTGRKLKVYAVEKNPNAVITLQDFIKTSEWEDTVTVVSCDMRFWNPPELADILVSEMLGSFGDNDLSPECLDGAQRFLKPDGISIPISYTSFIQPITASKLYSDVKGRNNLSYFETASSVKLHSVARLAPSQPVFTFTHPNFSRTRDNQCYKKLRFDLQGAMSSALVHGFAGYFSAQLYDDVYISIEPTTATPEMFRWFPMFFPLSKPVEVNSSSPLEAHIWRCSDSKKVWYEWSVTSPTVSPIHNTNGSSYWISL